MRTTDTVTVDDIDYILMFDLPEYRIVGNIIYRILFDFENTVFSLVEMNHDGEVARVLIDRIPYTIIGDRTLIRRDFYEDELRQFLE